MGHPVDLYQQFLVDIIICAYFIQVTDFVMFLPCLSFLFPEVVFLKWDFLLNYVRKRFKDTLSVFLESYLHRILNDEPVQKSREETQTGACENFSNPGCWSITGSHLPFFDILSHLFFCALLAVHVATFSIQPPFSSFFRSALRIYDCLNYQTVWSSAISARLYSFSFFNPIFPVPRSWRCLPRRPTSWNWHKKGLYAE